MGADSQIQILNFYINLGESKKDLKTNLEQLKDIFYVLFIKGFMFPIYPVLHAPIPSISFNKLIDQ